jgi:hypothetical protein
MIKSVLKDKTFIKTNIILIFGVIITILLIPKELITNNDIIYIVLMLILIILINIFSKIIFKEREGCVRNE